MPCSPSAPVTCAATANSPASPSATDGPTSSPRPASDRDRARTASEATECDRALAQTEALGPTYVKLGQLLSARPDHPQAYTAALPARDDVDRSMSRRSSRCSRQARPAGRRRSRRSSACRSRASIAQVLPVSSTGGIAEGAAPRHPAAGRRRPDALGEPADARPPHRTRSAVHFGSLLDEFRRALS